MSKTIVLTGAARGIGRCIARTLLEHGHRLFLIDVNGEELQHTAAKHLNAYSEKLHYAVCDLRDPSAVRETISRAAATFNQHIDVLISNGAIAHPYWKDGKSMDNPSTLDEWQSYIETNLTGPFVLAQTTIPYMKSSAQTQDPNIVLIGSFRAHQSDPNQEGYASTKAGLLGLMHSMAISCSQWGIRVNVVSPGRIKAQHESREGDEKGLDWAKQNSEKDADDHAVNRPGKPEDIAQAVEYIMNAGFVTGQEIVVDGGATKTKRI